MTTISDPATDLLTGRGNATTRLTLGLVILSLLVLPFSNTVFVPGGILAIWGIVLVCRHFRAMWSDVWIRWALLLMLALTAPQFLALFDAVNFERAFRTAATSPLYALAMLPLLWLSRVKDVGTPVLYIIFGLAVLWSLDGLLEFTTGSNVLGYPYNGSRVDGLFHPNTRLGIVLAHMLPLVLEASRRLMATTRLAALAPVLVSTLILLSGTRAAILIACITLILYGIFLVWLYRPRPRTIAGLSVIFMVGVTAALWASPETRARLAVIPQLAELSVEGVDAATSRRGTIWAAGWQIATEESLLGVGVRGFEPVAKERGYIDRGFSHIHLYGLDVLVSTGIVGLTAYLAAFIGILGAIWRRGRTDPAAWPACMAAALTIFVALNPINAHWTIYSSYTLSLVWLLIGISLTLLIRRPD